MHCVKSVQIQSCFWSVFSRIRTLRIQSKCEKIQTRNNFVFRHFSRSDSRHSILFHRNPEESKSGNINPLSTNVSIMDKSGSRFLLPKCLKNTCGRVIFKVKTQVIVVKTDYLVST